MELKIGDWVTSYHPGIWKIYKILHYKGIAPRSGLEETLTSIFSKRFVSPSFKRSFSQECCHPLYVSKLDEVTAAALEAFIKENAATYKKFLEYIPKPIDAVYNTRFGIPDGMTSKEVEALFLQEIALKTSEIDAYLTSLGLDTKKLPSWTAQFVSRGHFCEDDYLLYNFNRILEF